MGTRLPNFGLLFSHRLTAFEVNATQEEAIPKEGRR
jgi:hypothetical protein